MSEIYETAVYGDSDRILELLSRDPALINATDKYGFTPLHGVVAEHHFDVAKLLISRGADVNARDQSGAAPLHLAAYPEMVEILLKSGAAINQRALGGYTPLHSAAEHPESIEVMDKLLSLGADVNAKTDGGLTALDIAISREEPEKVELLESHGGVRGVAVA